MKVVAVREAKTGLSVTLDDAQRERVLITRNGRPCAIVIGVEGRDLEDVMLMSNPRFWRMIERSRKDPKTYSMEEVRAYFAAVDARSKGHRLGKRSKRAKSGHGHGSDKGPKGTGIALTKPRS